MVKNEERLGIKKYGSRNFETVPHFTTRELIRELLHELLNDL